MDGFGAPRAGMGTALRPMGTAARGGMAGGPMPTGTRMGTSRLGTASRPGTRGGPANLAGSNPTVMARPITQQGMTGMQMGQGPGRQVYDKNYWVTLLRRKLEDVQRESGRLEGELQQHDQQHSSFGQLQANHKSITDEVAKKKGTLHDLNKVAELGDGADVQDLLAKSARQRSLNDKQRSKIEDVFSERSQAEQQVKDLEKAMAQAQADAEQRLSQLSDNDRSRYTNFQREHSMLEEKAESLRNDYDKVCRQLSKLEGKLREEPMRERMHNLQEQEAALVQKKANLQKDSKEALSPAEEQAKLLEQVKDDKKTTKMYEKQCKELEEKVHELSDDISRMEGAGSSEARKGSSDDPTREQVEALKRGQDSMQSFLDGFEGNREKSAGELKTQQGVILALLEFLSRDAVNGLSIDKKLNKIEDSKSTLQRLQQQLEERKAEMDKIENLDSKIAQEMENLRQREKQMKQELETFKDMEGLRSKMDQSKKTLSLRREELKVRLAALNAENDAVLIKLNNGKRKVANGDSAVAIEQLENKMRHYEQNIFHLQEYIQSKEAEGDYSLVLDEASSLVAEINDMLVSSYQQL